MRPILVISVQVEWLDLDHARVLCIESDAMSKEQMDKYDEMVFTAVDDKFNPL